MECGQTWRRLASERVASDFNVPKAPATFDAIARLCADVLDPVVDRFGPLTLTYGFSSRELHKHIRHAIAPDLDQHAGHELNAKGKPICKRLGMAVDFFVAGHDSLELARWIAEHTRFDRLYVYGPEAPLHVSAGPDESRTVVIMATSAAGRRYPQRTWAATRWLQASKR